MLETRKVYLVITRCASRIS